MDELFALALEVQEYQRLEREREKIIQQIIELEIEASRDWQPE